MAGRDKALRDEQFAVFVGEASTSLMRTAWLLTGSQDQAHELVQAALVKTYVAWRRVRPGEATAYARRVLVNHKTDTWRRTRGEVIVADVPDRRVATTGTAAEDRDQLARLLATLPAGQRRVVVLRYYTDLSEQAVADLLGISTGAVTSAVKSAASRGLATLREAYAAAASPHSEAQSDTDQLTIEHTTSEGAER